MGQTTKKSIDELWKTIIDSMRKSNEPLGKLWKSDVELLTECDKCQEISDDVFVVCRQEKCTKSIHFKCLNGGVLFENGVLSMKCSTHFKNVLFCTCKEPYDEKDVRPMVCCDECNEWFHNSCVGINAKEVQKMIKYVCNSCKAILKEGRSVPIQLKEKNIEKEKVSSDIQAGARVVSLLTQLSTKVCPIVDAITNRGEVAYSIQDINSIFQYLSSPEMTQNDNLTEEDTIDTFNADTLLQLNVHILLDSWRQTIGEYLNNYDTWLDEANLHQKKAMDEFQINASKDVLAQANDVIKTLEEHEQKLRNDVGCIPAPDLLYYRIFKETIQWIHEFLQAFHEETKSVDTWSSRISQLLRQGSSMKLKKLHNVSYQDINCATLYPLVTDFMRMVSQEFSKLMYWSNEAEKIINNGDPDHEYELATVEEFLKNSSDLPTSPMLQNELKEFIEKVKVFNELVLATLNKKKLEDTEFESLILQKNSLSVRIPSDELLNFVQQQYIFLTAYKMTISETERYRYDVVMDLCEQAAELIVVDTDQAIKDKPIYKRMSRKKKESQMIEEEVNDKDRAGMKCAVSLELSRAIQDAQNDLKSITKAADSMTEKLKLELILSDDGEYRRNFLNKLKALKALTNEEMLLIFIEEAIELRQEYQQLLLKISQPVDVMAIINQGDANPTILSGMVSMENALELKTKMQALTEQTVFESFDVGKEMKKNLLIDYNSLCSSIDEADKLWGIISEAIEDCANGEAISLEDFEQACQDALETKLFDHGILLDACSLLVSGRDASIQCEQVLINQSTIEELSTSTYLEKCETLLQSVLHHPVKSSLALKIQTRHEVCKTVHDCKKMLDSHNEPLNAMDEDGMKVETSGKDISTMRDLYQSLRQLMESPLDGIEMELMSTIDQPFSLFHWCQEVRFLLSHRTLLTTAEKILQEGISIVGDEVAQTTVEWIDLQRELQLARAFFSDVENAMVQYNQVKDSHPSDSMEIDHPDQDEVAYKQFMHFVDDWTGRSTAVEKEFNRLLLFEGTMKIYLPDLAPRVREALSTMTQLNAAIHKLTTIHDVMHAIQNDNQIDHTSDSKRDQPVAEQIELQNLSMTLTQLLDKDPTFQLLQECNRYLTSILNQANAWNDSALQLLPQKSTRNKNKNETKVANRKESEDLLSKSIAQAVKMSMHDKLKETLDDADNLRDVLRSILIPTTSPSSIESSSVDSRDTKIGKSQKQADETIDPDAFRAKLLEDISSLNDAVNLSDLIPLDLSETRILTWTINLFQWMLHVPFPEDEVHDYTMSLETAQKKLNDASTLVVELSEQLLGALLQLGMIIVASDDSLSKTVPSSTTPSLSGLARFHPNIHPAIRRSHELYSFLQSCITAAIDFEEKARNVTKHNESEVEEWLSEIPNMVVQPDQSVKKNLEKVLSKVISNRRDVVTVEEVAPTRSRTRYKPNNFDSDFEYFTNASELGLIRAQASNRSLKSNDIDGDATMSVASSGGKKRGLTSDQQESQPRMRNATNKLQDLLPKSIANQSKRSKTRHKCGNPGCNNDILASKSSTFCSDRCAYKVAPMLLESLLEFRKTLQQLGKLDLSANQPELSKDLQRIIPDVEAFEVKSQLNDTGNEIQKVGSIDAGASNKNTSTLQLLYGNLPTIAASIAFCRKESAELSTPSPTIQRTYSNGSTSSNVNTPTLSTDAEIRFKMRLVLEEIFIRSLIRLKFKSSYPLGAVYAQELEEELYQKYTTTGEDDVIFNKKEYRKHHLTLTRNLRQLHNDRLIQQIVLGNLNVESLLNMSPQDFADPSLKLQREQEIHSMLDSHRRESLQETVMARSRAVMSGQSEGWRSKDIENVAPNDAPIQLPTKTETEVEALVIDRSPISPSSNAMRMKEETVGAVVEMETNDTDVGKEDEQDLNEEGAKKSTKRSIDVDAGTRFVSRSNKPYKSPKLEALKIQEDEVHLVESPLKILTPTNAIATTPRPQAPNILEILKANATTNAATGNDSSTPRSISLKMNASAATVSNASHGTVNLSAINSLLVHSNAMILFPLINSSGGDQYNINRPGGVNIICKGLVADKRIQGLVKSSFVVEGRTKIKDLEKFLNDVSSLGRKIVAPFRFEVLGDVSEGSGYRKYCDEFSKAERAGISNISDSIQVYIVPPELKANITILVALGSLLDEYELSLRKKSKDDNMDYVETVASSPGAVLYGVVVSKEMGPKKYMEMNMESLHGFLNNNKKINENEIEFNSSEAVPTEITSQRESAVKVNKNSSLVPPNSITKSTVPVPVVPIRSDIKPTAVAPVTPTPTTNINMADIRKVAQFCAEQGVQKWRELKEREVSSKIMPFLFEGQPGYVEFMNAVREFSGLSSTNPTQSSMSNVNNNVYQPLNHSQQPRNLDSFPNSNNLSNNSNNFNATARKSRFGP